MQQQQQHQQHQQLQYHHHHHPSSPSSPSASSSPTSTSSSSSSMVSSSSSSSSSSAHSSTSTSTVVHPSMSSASRNSSGSARSPRQRTQVNLSTIEKSVTHLLVATKQLLETLTAWSRQQATEAEVSDVYVRLGSEFNIACRAFTAIGVETADLGNVPDALRTILENTLSQDASPESLDHYLPRIREIIINLLHGLKRKQQKLRHKQARENGDGSTATSDRSSASSQPSVTSQRARSGGSVEEVAPPRSSSLPGGGRRDSPPVQSTGSARGSTSTTGSRGHAYNASISSNLSTATTVNGTPSEPPLPYPTIEEQPASPVPADASNITPPPPPPPPEPTHDAYAALQQHSSLERRASRRYSAYQIAKLTGKSPNDVPVLPSRDPTAIPRNRESMDAVRKRQSTRSRSANRGRDETSPGRNPNRISEEQEQGSADSPIAKTPEDKLGPPIPVKVEEDSQSQPSLKVDTGASPPPTPKKDDDMHTREGTPNGAASSMSMDTPPSDRRSSSPLDTKELTLFLQLGRSIKKVVLSDGVDELSITSLRLLFISKFNYNPPSGDDFPEIYLQDPVSGVRYELEDLRDVKDRAVLCLNVEVLDEVKRHIDDGMDGLKKLVQGLAGSVEAQGLHITRVAERQEEAAKKLAELSVAPPLSTPPTTSQAAPAAQLSKEETAVKLTEIRDLRKDLAVLRQVYSTFAADMGASMTTIKTKAKAVKQVAATTAVGPNEGRAYVETGKKTLGTDADGLVTRVDDLQDTVEDLRKDVVMRGVRPLPRQLNQVSKEIALARTELKKMNDYIKREKPLFRRVWERELEVVCEEQEFFNMQENLIADLEDDLDKAAQTFILVEQCSEQQVKTANGTAVRSSSRGFPQLVPVEEQLDPVDAKDSVLSEVRALQPNHESRLEAIERAERLRQKELDGRVPEFQRELGQFVEEGKLKKAGGFEEAERLRIVKDEQVRKEVWERTKKMKAEQEAAEAAAEAEAMNGTNGEAEEKAD